MKLVIEMDRLKVFGFWLIPLNGCRVGGYVALLLEVILMNLLKYFPKIINNSIYNQFSDIYRVFSVN